MVQQRLVAGQLAHGAVELQVGLDAVLQVGRRPALHLVDGLAQDGDGAGAIGQRAQLTGGQRFQRRADVEDVPDLLGVEVPHRQPAAVTGAEIRPSCCSCRMASRSVPRLICSASDSSVSTRCVPGGNSPVVMARRSAVSACWRRLVFSSRSSESGSADMALIPSINSLSTVRCRQLIIAVESARMLQDGADEP